MRSPDELNGLEAVVQRKVSRRTLLKRGGLMAFSVAATSALLTACGGDSEATPTTGGGQSSGGDGAATPTTSGSEQSGTSGQSSGGASTGANSVLNFGGIQEPITLDGHLSTSESDETLFNVYARLVTSDRQTGEITPELAEKWELSDDGLKVTFSLRDDALFHDGTTLDAEAVIYNFERCIALKSFLTEAFDNIAELEAPSQYEVVVTLKEPLAPFVSMMVVNPKMISPTAIEEHRNGDDYGRTWLTDNSAGSGAYQITRWDRGSNLVFEAFPDYWKGWDGPHVTTVNYRIVAEKSTQRLMLEAGELDVVQEPTFESISHLRANPELVVVDGNQPNQLYIQFNCYVGPTADVRVRKALCHAFNYEEFVSLLGLDPAPVRGDMPIPTELFGPDYKAVPPDYFTFDVDKAKALLAEAGYADGFDMNVFTDDGAQKVLLAEYFQAAMARIGVNVSVMIEPFTNLLARGTDQEQQKNLETAMHAMLLYTAPSYPDPSYFLLRMYTPYPRSVRNLIGYNNPEVERLLEEGLRAKDQKVALDAYWQANLIIQDDCPNLIVNKSNSIHAMRKNVKGYIPHVHKAWPWTFWDIWKED